uniref:Uncharacterized protein n=1 Tax=Oncorhynchus kisutch TaxID=8019 RepID=A0A8C7IUU2_ONCKI
MGVMGLPPPIHHPLSLLLGSTYWSRVMGLLPNPPTSVSTTGINLLVQSLCVCVCVYRERKRTGGHGDVNICGCRGRGGRRRRSKHMWM